MRLLSVLKLWQIVETSIMYENDGTTKLLDKNSSTNHTTVAAWARYAMWFTLFEEKGSIIRSVSKPSCRNGEAGPYDTKTAGSPMRVYNTRRG